MLKKIIAEILPKFDIIGLKGPSVELSPDEKEIWGEHLEKNFDFTFGPARRSIFTDTIFFFDTEFENKTARKIYRSIIDCDFFLLLRNKKLLISHADKYEARGKGDYIYITIPQTEELDFKPLHQSIHKILLRKSNLSLEQISSNYLDLRIKFPEWFEKEKYEGIVRDTDSALNRNFILIEELQARLGDTFSLQKTIELLGFLKEEVINTTDIDTLTSILKMINNPNSIQIEFPEAEQPTIIIKAPNIFSMDFFLQNKLILKNISVHNISQVRTKEGNISVFILRTSDYMKKVKKKEQLSEYLFQELNKLLEIKDD
ncbi:MAG: hypothetical protein PHV30_10610, partial [Candidatus Margulisbacteria bacterium]|nr:hypothetical protein [Candidatus Margulisiibacteriota bacterium]